MAEPTGDDSELWELVELDGSRVWALPRSGQTCRIRSTTHGGVLQPDGAPETRVPLKAGDADGTGSLWTIHAGEGSRFRIEHGDSRFVLNISANTGRPILSADEGRADGRFHFDSVASPPARLQWSHGLGTKSEVVVSPDHSTNYVVDAEIDGLRIQSRVAVTVALSFDEWMDDWFGDAPPDDPDGDGDGAPLLLEYARGSDPKRADSSGWQQGTAASDGNLILRWSRNREAIGTWTPEVSTDLARWDPVESQLTTDPGQITLTSPMGGDTARFFRLRFDALVE
jgi:hypothetical protein